MAPFTLPGNERKQAPSHIILNTRAVVLELRRLMLPYVDEVYIVDSPLIHAHWRDDMDKVLVEILQIIASKKDAELSLQYESMQIVNDAMGEHNIEQVVQYTRFLVELGMHLVTVLQRIGAYENGMLMYAYKGMQLENIVLEHILFTGGSNEEASVPT